eukprot:TRINITY_DN30523_c0_g1_i1.p1 TRINITY_DN30523_c0_g1~~TRINITY_DN30523_c0_g1_i1.p1  ORF type:complete len:514 (+),score=91.27 TRINITY_DN30523_c0_g1_i1:49-1590(+)
MSHSNMLTHDPRTGLQLVQVPPRFQQAFAYASKGSILYWFGAVRRYLPGWKDQEQVLMVSYTCMYFATLQGSIKNCLRLRDIDALVFSPERDVTLGIKMTPESREPDICFDAVGDGRNEVADIIQTVHQTLYNQQVQVIEHHPLNHILNIEYPPGWKLNNENLPHVGLLEEGLHTKNLIQQAFHDVKENLKHTITEDQEGEEFEHVSRNIDMYMEMLEDRDREIERLQRLRDNVYDDPNVWAACPNCKDRRNEHTKIGQQRTIHSLERQLADCEHLLSHLQHNRSITAPGSVSGNVRSPDGYKVSESTSVIQLKRQIAEESEKLQNLRDIIIESHGCYRSETARVDALSRVGDMPADGTAREKQLARHAHDLELEIAEKDKELRLSSNVLRESFRNQVTELNKLKESFASYDREIVQYLERYFSGEILPPGIAPGQTPREMATLTAEAAKSAATPVRIPHPTREANDFIYGEQSQQQPESHRKEAWLGANLRPLHERNRLGSVASSESRKSFL